MYIYIYILNKVVASTELQFYKEQQDEKKLHFDFLLSLLYYIQANVSGKFPIFRAKNRNRKNTYYKVVITKGQKMI